MSKPRVLLLPDVNNWAWWIKSKYIQKYLCDEFEIEVIALNSRPNKVLDSSFDIYMVYTPAHSAHLRHVDREKRIAGVTGHLAVDRHVKGKRLDNHFVALHANSKMLEEELKKHHSKVYYTPNGVDLNVFHQRPFARHKSVVVGFLGRKLPGKGLTSVIRPAVNLVSGAVLVENIKSWKNAQPLASLSDFYASIDVYMVASIVDGTPNPALEAAATGRPIISNRIGNMPEFIKDGVNGFLVPRKSPAYAEKLRRLVKDRKLLAEMGKQARATVEEQWTWEIQAENYRKMFREVLGCQKS